MRRKLNKEEAYAYVLNNIDVIKKQMYFNHVTYNEEDIYQDLMIILPEKLQKKYHKYKDNKIIGYKTMVSNDIKNLIEKYGRPCKYEVLVRHDESC